MDKESYYKMQQGMKRSGNNNKSSFYSWEGKVMKLKIMDDGAARLAFLTALHNEDEAIDMINKQSEQGDFSFDVEFTVNGVTLDFQKFINRLVDSYDEYLEKEAKSLLEDKAMGIMQKLQQMHDDADQILEVAGIK